MRSALLIVVGCCWCFAQRDIPHFDVVSVKLTEARPSSLTPPSFHDDAGRIDYRVISMRNLMLRAFPVENYQVVWPKWMESQDAFYDISATMREDTTPQQLQLMLQSLLTDRFKLTFHRETRDVKDYELEVSSHGLKIQPSKNPPDSPGPYSMQRDQNGLRLMQPTKEIVEQVGLDPAKSGFTIRQLINAFSARLDRPMIDMTGLEGYYDIELFVPFDLDAPPEISSTGRGSRMPGAWSNALFFDALEKQLGLTVKARTGPIETLVIDHLERVPTGN